MLPPIFLPFSSLQIFIIICFEKKIAISSKKFRKKNIILLEKATENTIFKLSWVILRSYELCKS